MLDLNIDEVKATEAFYASKTFTQLATFSTELYKKDWQEIYEMLQKELIHNSKKNRKKFDLKFGS